MLLLSSQNRLFGTVKMNELSESQIAHIRESTLRKTKDIGLANARTNLPLIKKTILDVPDEKDEDNTPVIVVSAGPSLHRRNSVQRIVQSNFKGIIVAADGALGACLRNGLVPHYVVSVDPHPTRIVRWFGDSKLHARQDDDYFRRQDLDPVLHKQEQEYNNMILGLVNKHGKEMKMILSTSAAPAVTERCVESGMNIYWWNPLYDDYEKKDSISRQLYKENKVPCMVTGGNVGTSAWVFAHSVLKKKNIAFVGMDFGYAPGTPLLNTQYYTEIKELFGEDRVHELYISIHNPYLNEDWFTDPAYYWYRQGFLELLETTGAMVHNCTEGGVLFGKGIEFVDLDVFLDKFKQG